MALDARFRNLQLSLGSQLLERDEEVHTAVLALLTGFHHFQYGPPGVAKSQLVDRLFDHIADVSEGEKFSYLLTKFTVPEEVMGFLDLDSFKKTGVYRKVTARRLPEARIVFLDECFNGSSAILNALLKALNERKFDRGDKVIDVPLLSAFAASNNIPSAAELSALADRLHFWHDVKPLRDPANKAKLLSDWSPPAILEEDKISLAEIETAQGEIRDNVTIPDEIVRHVLEVLEGLKGREITVSDRRARQAMQVIRAEAWLNGRTEANAADMGPLVHLFWKSVDKIDEVYDEVTRFAAPLERKLREIETSMNQMLYETNKQLSDTTETSKKRSIGVEALEKMSTIQAEINTVGKKAKADNQDMTNVLRLRDLHKAKTEELRVHAFNLPKDEDVQF